LSARVVEVGRKPISDYVFDIVVSFQEGEDYVVIKGYGPYTSKAVDLYNRLLNRLGEGIELVKVEIGSERIRGRDKSYIAIHIRRKY